MTNQVKIKEPKFDQERLDNFYTGIISLRAKTSDKEELQAFIDKKGITSKTIIDNKGQSYFTIVDKKHRVIAQQNLKLFLKA